MEIRTGIKVGTKSVDNLGDLHFSNIDVLAVKLELRQKALQILPPEFEPFEYEYPRFTDVVINEELRPAQKNEIIVFKEMPINIPRDPNFYTDR